MRLLYSVLGYVLSSQNELSCGRISSNCSRGNSSIAHVLWLPSLSVAMRTRTLLPARCQYPIMRVMPSLPELQAVQNRAVHRAQHRR